MLIWRFSYDMKILVFQLLKEHLEDSLFLCPNPFLIWLFTRRSSNNQEPNPIREELKKMWIYSHLLLTHPPPKCGKNKKKTCCFLGFVAHLEQKKISEVFSPCHPPLPPTGAINLRYPSPPPTTDKPHCRHQPW